MAKANTIKIAKQTAIDRLKTRKDEAVKIAKDKHAKEYKKYNARLVAYKKALKDLLNDPENEKAYNRMSSLRREWVYTPTPDSSKAEQERIAEKYDRMINLLELSEEDSITINLGQSYNELGNLLGF